MHFLSKCTFFTALATLVLSVSMARAEPPHREHWDHDEHRGFVLDQRYHHNRYYPPHGYVTGVLPVGYVTIRHPTGEYFFHEGVWYGRRGPGFIVIAPPVGVAIATLPVGFTTVWVRGVSYFYANNVYYVQRPEGYVVVEAPNESEVVAARDGPAPPQSAPAGSDELFIYPKNQQSPDQQAKDRYECHSWAATQTGFDPTRAAGGVPPGQVDQKRADYRRAMGACLEARGYTVK